MCKIRYFLSICEELCFFSNALKFWLKNDENAHLELIFVVF